MIARHAYALLAVAMILLCVVPEVRAQDPPEPRADDPPEHTVAVLSPTEGPLAGVGRLHDDR